VLQDRSDGYASLLAISAVFIVTGLTIAWAGPFLARARNEKCMLASWARADQLEKEAITLLSDIERKTGGETREMLTYDLPPNSSLCDSQSRLAVNWAPTFIFRESPIRDLLRNGSPEELQMFRAKTPITISGDMYRAFFDEVDIEKYFSLTAPLNVNTVDELSFANVMTQLNADVSSGINWQDKLRSLRLQKRALMTDTDLQVWFGATWDSVCSFVSSTPEWNANSIDPFILTSVLHCPSFGIQDPASAAGAILQARAVKYLEDEDLHRILGLPESAVLWNHLGTTSSSWTLTIKNGEGLSLSVWFVRRAEGQTGPVFRLVSRHIRHE